MTNCLTELPTPQSTSAIEVSPVSSQAKHALLDSSIVWPDSVSTSGQFLRVGSVVPATVFQFADDGTAVGLISDPTAVSPVAVWAKQQLAHIPDWTPGDDFSSPHCAHRFFTTLPCGTKLPFSCTETPAHTGEHKALGETDVQAHVSRRKPTPRKRVAA